MRDRDVEQLVLTFKRYVYQFAVAEELVWNIDVAALPQDLLFGQVTLQLQTQILSDDLPPERLTERHRVTYEVPASSWQMWKKRHGRRWYATWLVARWPVQYEPDPDGRGTDAVCTFDLERYRTYPRARVQLPPDQYGRPYLAHTLSGPLWEEDSPDA